MEKHIEAPHFADVDRCLLTNKSILSLSKADAAGLLERRSNISGWYTYWFSLSGSQLQYFEITQRQRRGLLAGVISLFRHKLSIVNSIKRRREFEIVDAAGKVHVLRAGSDAELHWWVQLIDSARKKIPPAQPINPSLSLRSTPDVGSSVLHEECSTFVDTHLEVNHVLCVVHGIGVSSDILSANSRSMRESYIDIMARVFPDIDFRVEVLVIHWREALTNLDVHKKLQAVVPIAPEPEDANPLRQFMVHRIVDYVYYTHDRYRRHILREVASQLNTQIDSFRRRRPDFKGKISIMGHSLGAALCYDLMCRKVRDDQVLLASEGMRLNFDADNLFCFGNPLGTFLGLDPTIGMGSNMLTLPFRIFNVFKYHDPIATRLEPQIDFDMVDVCPVTVPCWFNMGLRESTAQWLSTWWPGGEKRKSGVVATTTPGEGVAAGHGERAEENGDVVEGNGVEGSSLRLENGTSSRRNSYAEAVESGQSSPSSASRSEGDGDVVDVCEARTVGLGDGGSYGGTPRKGRHRIRVRLDYALQASSTMEDVSTSWSALRAHTEYWSNRDAMLLMVSQMMKSSFGIGDGCEPEDGELTIIDADILKRQEKVWGVRGFAPEAAGVRRTEETLEEVVRRMVEKMVDEAVATHELMKVHPQLRIRRGGVTSKTPTGSREGLGKEPSGSPSSGGWASYLRSGWFGSENKEG